MPPKRRAKNSLESVFSIGYCFAGVGLLAFATIYFRPLWPIDETRYVSVAWEMWNGNSFLIPRLNGELYSHKPPLLFWLIHAGWVIFGLNEWWPRILPFIFAFANVVVTRKLVMFLYGAKEIREYFSLVLLGYFIFLFFSSVVMFDMLLLFFVTLSYIFLFKLSSGKKYIAFLGCSIGLGMLTKGPVMLLHVLPISFIFPWIFEEQESKRYYYLRLFLALAVGIVLVSCWVIPASILGGETFRKEILWTQTAGRVTKSFAHKGPWWYYLGLLPAILLPWSLAFVKWIEAFKGIFKEKGNVFCFILILLEVVLFSLISAKQVFYILPIVVPGAMLVAYALKEKGLCQIEVGLINALFFLLGLLMAFSPYLADRFFNVPPIFKNIPPYYGIFLAILAGGLFFLHMKTNFLVIAVSIQTLLCFILTIIGPVNVIAKEYDLRPAAITISKIQLQGYEVYHVGKYHGEYHFLGRLKKRILQIDERDVQRVLYDHANVVIWVVKDVPNISDYRIIYHQPFQGKHLYILQGPKGEKVFVHNGQGLTR